MNLKTQGLILTILILFSVTVTKLRVVPTLSITKADNVPVSITDSKPYNLSYRQASLVGVETPFEITHAPIRNWSVLDPKINAQAVLIDSLDDNYPFLRYNTYKEWPLASLTKLISSVVVFEDIGINKKVSVSQNAVDTEGNAGELRSGEVYTARDLLKIMLLRSSNDAAVAFEEYLGKDGFVKLMNDKAHELGMTSTKFYDASGLDDNNKGTASDMLRLAKYILESEPDILNWTRITQTLVQPINDTTSRELLNINGLVSENNFFGGKTGTSDKARQNLLAIFSLDGKKIILIILGSEDRMADAKSLMAWVKSAYQF
ncbi:MAG: serine hydrolase [Patescibacteria group bacterium]